jgi:hypothetical protein
MTVAKARPMMVSVFSWFGFLVWFVLAEDGWDGLR